ncbi:type II secretion system (T2SS) protein B [Geothermobacter ehrlichii]|uniref:Type II secretion system (T2SS) protein B n=1 Tax=Geothermobacter ehrlichii TaxID=213224 RepID=A0A5D3WRC6_9BACT|nr:general secretion pathway protein GspB [Geothermobacter ehrlichii]TYP00340.1 type II secretion system (T2SS) protein B [Geothermobacter ehrlichii]
MSYILDSLRKAERKRRAAQEGVDLPMPELDTAERKRSWWPEVLAAALLLNTVLFLVWAPWKHPAPPRSEATAGKTLSAREAEAIARTASRKTVSPVAQRSEPRETSSPVTAPSSAQPPVAAPSAAKLSAGKEAGEARRPPATQQKILSLEALPPSISRSLPPLQLSMHFYAADPARRIVRLDGKLLRQGDRPAPGLTIREITRFGVVLEKDGYLFEIPRP